MSRATEEKKMIFVCDCKFVFHASVWVCTCMYFEIHDCTLYGYSEPRLRTNFHALWGREGGREGGENLVQNKEIVSP